MVVREGELRDAEIVRPRLGAFVDARIEVDIVHPGRAGGLHENLYIALAVEGADISRVVVVVDNMVDVGGLRPAAALEMDRESGAGRSARDIDGQRRWLDPVATEFFPSTNVDPKPMRA